MSPREAAAAAMVQAGATRRAACEEHAVYPANLRRAMTAMTGARGDMQPEYSPLGKKIERKPEPLPTKHRAPEPPPALGVKIGPDGKWHTDIPPPKAPL